MQSTLSAREVEQDLAFAIEAAALAGQRVMALRATGRWQGKTLADVGDQAADALLQGLVRGRYPRDGLLSEETADSQERLSKPRAWIIDPLDGTKEYSELREDFAVHVALTLDGRCALGAVALPARGQVMWGVALPAELRSGLVGDGTLLAGASVPNGAPRLVVSRSHTPPWIERFAASIGAAELLPVGSVGFKATRSSAQSVNPKHRP